MEWVKVFDQFLRSVNP